MSNYSESIKVVFRVRPLNSKEIQNCCKIATVAHEKEGVIEIRNLLQNGDCEYSKTFAFDAVFSEESSQRHIYDVCAAPVVQSVLEGYNGTVFAYGQTGAGKTHTMEGLNEPDSLKGIMPNAFEHIFDHIALVGSQDKYLVRASYFEIYKEEIRDLLSQSPQRLELKETESGTVFVKDLTDVVVKCVSDIDRVLQQGKKHRSVGATLMNAGSSRSHAIFSIVIECCSTDGQDERIRVGKLNLVDLAGSERQSKTGATGERLKEATKINLSLSALGNVISALVDGKSSHIPYRDSKLTRILQDSLGGNTKTVMCANAGPADYNYDESLSTLRYANRAKNVKNRPVINDDPKEAKLREYQEEIARLKNMLSQIPASSRGANGASDEDRETLLKECRSKASKETEDMVAKTDAEMKKIRLDHHKTAEERAALQKKLEDETKARLIVENQRLELQNQLRKMEAELITGGEVANNAVKQEAALRIANQELIAQKESELAMTRKMNEQADEKLHLEEKYSSLAEEVNSKTKKLKKIWAKYQQAKVDIEDLEHEFMNEKNEMLDSIRQLTKQLKLKDFIIQNFIPPKVSSRECLCLCPKRINTGSSISRLVNHCRFLTLKYALLYDDVENGGRAVWDESKETWNIPPLKQQSRGVIIERSMTRQSHHRPETEFARRRKVTDSNPRWRTEDIVDLDIAMPTKRAPKQDDANTMTKIRAILAMDLNEPIKKTTRGQSSEKLSASDNAGKSKPRPTNETSKYDEHLSQKYCRRNTVV